MLGCWGLCRGQLLVYTHTELVILKSLGLSEQFLSNSVVWTLCMCVCVCALIDKRAIPFQLCSFTHLALHYAAFMLFLRFWGKRKMTHCARNYTEQWRKRQVKQIKVWILGRWHLKCLNCKAKQQHPNTTNAEAGQRRLNGSHRDVRNWLFLFKTGNKALMSKNVFSPFIHVEGSAVLCFITYWSNLLSRIL